MARIDTLLNRQAFGNVRRVGDLRTNAPYVHFSCEGDSAFLPMPISIVSANQALWEQTDYTADSLKGAAAMGALSKGGNDISGTFGNYVKEYSKAVTKDMASDVASAVSGIDGYGDYILHKEGKAVNPNKEVTFEGINYRTFEFDFQLIPLDQKQAESIEMFIAFFQEKAMPAFADAAKVYFAYPGTWDIVFSKNVKLPKIMPCYLKNYSIDYGAAGKMVFHKSGHVVQINIGLEFIEADLHTRDKVRAFPG